MEHRKANYRGRGPIPMTAKKLEIEFTAEEMKAKNMKFGVIDGNAFQKRIENAKKLEGRIIANTMFPAEFKSQLLSNMNKRIRSWRK